MQLAHDDAGKPTWATTGWATSTSTGVRARPTGSRGSDGDRAKTPRGATEAPTLYGSSPGRPTTRPRPRDVDDADGGAHGEPHRADLRAIHNGANKTRPHRRPLYTGNGRHKNKTQAAPAPTGNGRGQRSPQDKTNKHRGRNGSSARPSTSRARDGRLHPQRPGRHGRVRGRH